MNKLYLLASVLLVTSCQTPTTPNVKGTYRYLGDGKPAFGGNRNLEFTTSKFIMGGSIAMDYKVEDGYVFVGTSEGQTRFKVISEDTLRAEVNDIMGLDGTYVRVKE